MKQVVLSCDALSGEVKDPWGNLRTGTTARTKINRKDFGINFSKAMDNGGAIVADDVAIELDIELTRKAI
jgi:polyisoprenoid-binding protein YceI